MKSAIIAHVRAEVAAGAFERGEHGHFAIRRQDGHIDDDILEIVRRFRASHGNERISHWCFTREKIGRRVRDFFGESNVPMIFHT